MMAAPLALTTALSVDASVVLSLAPLSGSARTLLLPETVMQSGWFAVLAAFVAINTVMYASLAVAKMLPKVYVSDWFTSANRRTRSRGIYPEDADARRGPTPRREVERAR